MNITLEDFMSWQPETYEADVIDKYYATVANRLASTWQEANVLTNISDKLKREIILSVMGYYQDIVADLGLWRSFSTMCDNLYGSPVPFFERDDSYIDSELNESDLRFIIWHVLELSNTEKGLISPYHKSIEVLAQRFFEILDYVYESMPSSVNLMMLFDVDLSSDDADSQHTVLELAHWLFNHSYLLRYSHDEAIDDMDMAKFTVGPLALYVSEWIDMIVEQKTPKFGKEKATKSYSNLIKVHEDIDIKYHDLLYRLYLQTSYRQ